MLKSIEITRFKSIRDQKIDLGAVNLFIGGNGSGKSNVLEAIGLASACLGRGLSDSDLKQKGLRVTRPELMKSSFKNEDLPKTLTLSVEFDSDVSFSASLQSREGDPLLRFFSERATSGGKPCFGRSNRGARLGGNALDGTLESHRGIWDQVKAVFKADQNLEREFSQFANYVIYSPQTDFLRGRKSGPVDLPPIGLHGEGLPDAVSSFLDAFGGYSKPGDKSPEAQIMQSTIRLIWLPGWAQRANVRPSQPFLDSHDMEDRSSNIVYFYDKFMHQSRNRLSVYDSSEGTLFLLFAMIILAHPESPRIFALDNVDSALNPRLTRKLVEEIIKVSAISNSANSKVGARQVFLTSHNPTSLDAFDLFDDRTRVFVVARNEKGHTQVERLRPPEACTREDWEVAKAGRNLSQLWLDGEILGALGAKL
jgi:hypothetical protein